MLGDVDLSLIDAVQMLKLDLQILIVGDVFLILEDHF